MDHSLNDKRFCVYVLKDVDGIVRYVGSGTKLRAYNKNRSNNKDLLAVIRELDTEVLETDLSKDESILREIGLYEQYKSTGLLLNKQRPSGILPIDYELVNKYLYYDETSPTFLRWKIDIPSGRYGKAIKTKANDVAGSLKKSGYSETKLLGRLYKNHRLVWVLCNNKSMDSNLVIDHIDRNKSNNKFENLRLVTQKQNMNNALPDTARAIDGLLGIYDPAGQPMIYSTWRDGVTSKCKTFNYKKIFPHLDIEVAKDKCIELAVWYRQQMTEICSNNLINKQEES